MIVGMYEFGRDDGSMEPRFVRIAHNREGVPFPTCATEEVLRLARAALSRDGFWWRLFPIPRECPIDPHGEWLVMLPPAPRGGGA